MRAARKPVDLAARLGRAIVLVVLLVVVLAFIVAHVSAWRWIGDPFLGMMVEPTLVLSPLQSRGWARLALDPPLEQPDRLVAVDGQPVARRADLRAVLGSYAVGDRVTVQVQRPDGSLREERITLTSFPTRDVILIFVLPYLAGLAYLGVGVWVYWVQGWGSAGQVFTALCAAIALLLGGIFDVNTTHWLSPLWCAAMPFAAAILVHLALIFPQAPRFAQRFPWLRLLPYVPAAYLASRSAVSVYDVSRPWVYIDRWRNGYLFAAVGIAFLLAMLIYRLVRPPSPLVRQQSRVILLGSALAFLPIVPWLVLNVLGNPVPFLAAIYAPLTLFFPLSIAYAILRYRLLDVDRLLSQGVTYASLTFLIVATYAMVVNGLSQILAIGATDPVVLSLFVLVLTLLFNRLRNWVQRMVDRLFYRETVDYRASLQDFSHGLTQTLDLDAVLAEVSKQVERALHPALQWIYLYDEAHDGYVGQVAGEGQPSGFEVTFEQAGDLARWLQQHQECLYLPAGDALPSELAGEVRQIGALGAVVYAPLRTREWLSGWLALGPKRSGQPYRSDDLAFLSALADQSALAVENARLFASVRRNLAAITEMKNLMDDVFSSIASGVITTDVQDKVTLFNRAAEAILCMEAGEAIGSVCHHVLEPLGTDLQSLLGQVKRSEAPVMAYEVQPELPARGPVWLRMNLSPLKDSQDMTTGVAIVLDDLTERRQLEARVRRVRQTFERYVAPTVVERLLSNPESVRLGGVRQEITSFYADIRGFTSFSERTEPEFQIDVLNKHLTLAAGAILEQEGTLDKFVGDSAMAIFNAPEPQEDHTLRAVRAALAMQRAVRRHHTRVDEGERLHFGIGISVGEAVVGNIGSVIVQNFTAVGDCVNLSARLSSLAKADQILLSAQAYERVRDQVEVLFIGDVQVKGHSHPDRVYELLGVKED